MNKNNKLVKGAVRERKARKERAHEQDKPKRCKRWFNRLLALFGCLLLVSALVVPCFAADRPNAPDYSQEWNDLEVQLKNNLLGFYSGKFNNDSYDYFTSRLDYVDFIGTSGYAMITSGDLDKSRRRVSFDYEPGDGSLLNIIAENVDVSWSISVSGTLIHENMATADVSFYGDESNYLSVFIGNYGANETWREFVYLTYLWDAREDSVQLDGGAIEIATNQKVTFGSNDMDDYDIEDVQISLTIGYPESMDVSFMSELSSILFGSGDKIVYPRIEYLSIISGFDQAKNLGQTLIGQAFNSGYDEGLDQDAFQEGYDQAVSEIDSGEFGKNFWNVAFKGPIGAALDIVLVEWEVEEGKAPFVVTLGSLVYLVIGVSVTAWFLKVALGG